VLAKAMVRPLVAQPSATLTCNIRNTNQNISGSHPLPHFRPHSPCDDNLYSVDPRLLCSPITSSSHAFSNLLSTPSCPSCSGGTFTLHLLGTEKWQDKNFPICPILPPLSCVMDAPWEGFAYRSSWILSFSCVLQSCKDFPIESVFPILLDQPITTQIVPVPSIITLPFCSVLSRVCCTYTFSFTENFSKNWLLDIVPTFSFFTVFTD
jgi:hypothetical protein